MNKLSEGAHGRGSAGLTYVYPVVSRRAAGVSIGINLNPNNACNWRCEYCQVPNLTRGLAPPCDLDLLDRELMSMLDDVLRGSFMVDRVPEGSRVLRDVALSGNGESSTCPNFVEALAVIRTCLEREDLTGKINVVLITNGSQLLKTRTVEGLDAIAELGGEAWVKVDSATLDGSRRINGVGTSPETIRHRLARSAAHVRTWIQTCMFATDGEPPEDAEVEAYLGLLRDLVRAEIPIEGVLLYGLAREPMQAIDQTVTPLPAEWLETLGQRIRSCGVKARVTP